MRARLFLRLSLGALVLGACEPAAPTQAEIFVAGPVADAPPLAPFVRRLIDGAAAQSARFVAYDPSYVPLAYPMGDVPVDRGVCSDVIVRAYRAAGIDLQALVHEDMTRAFAAYPGHWGLRGPDPNIDHRRVPNLETFFARHGGALAVSEDASDYAPGDLVTWSVAGRPHIGLVSDRRTRDGARPLIVHNIGWGVRIEDMLFDYPITGHYRYWPGVPAAPMPIASPRRVNA
ncbi:MAG: DUF1287 domain-containing protein [Alphaproteobacteria bacterium]|nr:DUF1287 domain-containing protein [Alphaproteobacteria bacterium]